MDSEPCCSCLKKYRKLGGVLDILIGITGFIYISYLTYMNRTRRNGLISGTEKLPFIADELKDELDALDNELRIDAILYLVPAMHTILVGILILVAANKDSFAWSKVALTMNVILIVVCSCVVSMTFGLGTYWMRLIPVLINTGIQIVILGMVLELYYSTQHLVKLRR